MSETPYRRASGRGAAREVSIPPVGLGGSLSIPAEATGLVLFAHGSGSSRFSPRNNHVAEALRDAGLGTLLFDLLTEREAADRANVFDIPLLAERLVMAAHWMMDSGAAEGRALGYFGSSTGAAAALVAAAQAGEDIAAVVSRGGRPDLAGAALAEVKAPTLLIVGGLDTQVLELNRAAYAALACEKEIAVVRGATHLFEEPGTLDEVIVLARDWFVRHLQGGGRAQG
jgi:predicted alpha/beta-hydrolase family hydrolase